MRHLLDGVLVVISWVVLVAGWAAGWWLWGRPRRLTSQPARTARTAGPGGDDRPVVHVVIPARDEAEVLPLLLGDLAADPDPARRVVVVDDHSSDATAVVAAAHDGATVVAAPALPVGWTGKSWACHTGVTAVAPSAGPDDLVVFVDADVRLGPGALRAVEDEVRRRGGAVSVQPFHTTERAYEQLSLFSGLVTLLGAGAGRRRGEPAGLFGPVLASRLDDHRRVGGHESVRSEVTEDLALGRRFRAAGLPVAVLLGGPLVRFRMYPAGLGQLVEGWSKNLATGAGAVPRHRSLAVALWITALGSAALALPGVPGGPDGPGWWGVAAYLAVAVQVGVLGRTTGTFGPLTAVAFPVPLVAFVGFVGRSLWGTVVRREVTWRGRSISVGSASGS